MADETTGAEEQSQDAQGTEGETGAEDTSNDGAAAEGTDDAEGQDGQQTGTDTEEEPPVRKSPKDFIIQRQAKKIEKLQGGSAEAQGEQEQDSTAGESPKVDIHAAIQEQLAPIAATFARTADEQALTAALTKYPEAKKIEKTVRKYMENDAYARVPVEFIVRGLLGASEVAKKRADDAARGSRQGGHTRRPTEQKQKSAWELSDAEFDKAVTNLMSGKTQ